jgi:hypothetical protein
MIYVDADGNASTFNSSSSQLSLPSDATVLWAGLYWGARTAAGVGGAAATGNPKTMLLQVPGASSYQTITSQQAFGPLAGDSAYQQFADVTSFVQAAGAGTYWGANVAAATGQDRYAGWSLAVVYRSPSLPLRNLTVFDGFTAVGSGAPQTITISGFLAPLAGTVATQLGLVRIVQ